MAVGVSVPSAISFQFDILENSSAKASDTPVIFLFFPICATLSDLTASPERWGVVYDPVSPQQTTEVLSRIFALLRKTPPRTGTQRSGERAGLSPDLLSNLRQFGSTPTPRQLQALKLRLSLTIGGAFKLFGYGLDSMRYVESLLNGEQTRFVESYGFFRDRLVDLPRALGKEDAFEQSAFLSDLVVRWQEAVPIRAIRGPHWQKEGFHYAQLGLRDKLAMPKVPPGSIVAIRPVDKRESENPNPDRMYFLQHGSGYLCCGCAVRKGRLLIITQDRSYSGPKEFRYPGEIRIVGRVASFGVRLPLAKPTSVLPPRTYKPAPLIFPWEHNSFATLMSIERKRFGITEAHLKRANEIFESRLGTTVSARTLRRYEHEKDRVPHTAVLIGLALIPSLRFTDVLRTLGLWTDESEYYSLAALMNATTHDDLPTVFPEAAAPDPVARWQPMLDEWGEWPTLLSMAVPDLRKWGHRILRIDQSAWFKGLDPIVAPHSVAVLDELNLTPSSLEEKHQYNWDRPIFALRHERRTICGYLEVDGPNLALIPHPFASGVPRMNFPRRHVQILGRIAGVASPL